MNVTLDIAILPTARTQNYICSQSYTAIVTVVAVSRAILHLQKNTFSCHVDNEFLTVTLTVMLPTPPPPRLLQTAGCDHFMVACYLFSSSLSWYCVSEHYMPSTIEIRLVLPFCITAGRVGHVAPIVSWNGMYFGCSDAVISTIIMSGLVLLCCPSLLLQEAPLNLGVEAPVVFVAVRKHLNRHSCCTSQAPLSLLDGQHLQSRGNYQASRS